MIQIKITELDRTPDRFLSYDYTDLDAALRTAVAEIVKRRYPEIEDVYAIIEIRGSL